MGELQERLADGEHRIGRWEVDYVAVGGRRARGTLTVTDERILFRAPFDRMLANGLQLLGVAGAELTSAVQPRPRGGARANIAGANIAGANTPGATGIDATGTGPIGAVRDGTDLVVFVERAGIAGVVQTRTGGSKRAEVSTTAGTTFVFDSALDPIESIVDAVSRLRAA